MPPLYFVVTSNCRLAVPPLYFVVTSNYSLTVPQLYFVVTSKLQPDIGVLHMDTEGKKSIKERIGGTIVTAATTTTRATKAKTTMAGSHKGGLKV